MKYKPTFTNYINTIEIDLERDSNLTEYAVGMLKDRYMLADEQSPQEAFARAACAFADDTEHAQRLYDYASKLWFMFATPLLCNGGTQRGLPISCITGDSPVITASGAKQVKDIKVGDKVLTHKNRFKKVVGKKTSLSSDTYRLVVNKRKTPITITGNHLVLTNYGWVRVDELNIKKHLIASNTILDVKENIPSIKIKNKQTPHSQFKRKDNFVEFDVAPDFMWALGFWFAEGSTSNNGAIRVTHGSKEPCQKWADIMHKYFNVKPTVNSYRKTWSNGEVYSKTLQEWFDEEFGKGCKVKTLTEWIVNSPKEHLESFMEGFYLGDGYKTTKNKAFELANPELIAGLHLILLRLGIRHSMNLGKKTTYSTNGIICYDEDSVTSNRNINSVSRGFECNNLVYNSISSLEFLGEEELVYDIQVEEDESFSVAGFIVHNCFLNHVGDSCEGLANNYAEDIFLSRYGGGIGTYFGAVRSEGEITSKGNKTTGIIPFLKVVDSLMLAFQQGANRRGSAAVYTDVSHPEIEEFIEIRRPTRADDRRTNYLHHAINIPDDFMKAVENDTSWDLVDPNSRRVKKQVKARELWVKIIKARIETGEPYLHFIDTSNAALPQALKNRGLRISTSNLCNEIYLPTTPDRTAVCCLSSVNIEKYDEWKDDELFIEDLIRMLDNVLQNFIDNAHPEMWRARNSAYQERSLGLGAMGFHAYLQANNIPFESVAASAVNQKVFSKINLEAKTASLKLADERGEAPDMEGTGYRNAHLIAIAPNASSSIVCGETSPSIEPLSTNIFNKKTLNGTKTFKNPMLERVLEDLGYNTDEVWYSIMSNNGSVQHLTFLDDNAKEVFKTAFEIDQRWVVKHAADRQKFVCQGQSVNLFFSADTSFGTLHSVHKAAWQSGLKGLYYCRSFNSKRAETGGLELKSTSEEPIVVSEGSSCLMCEG